MCVIYFIYNTGNIDENRRYDSRVPPKLIRMWFEKAPMLFLVIAAIAFVIGLNIFSYLSLQVRRKLIQCLRRV